LGLNRIFQALSKVELLLELEKHNLTATTYQAMRHFCLVLFILAMILLVTNPCLVNCRALRSGTQNEINDHHEATDTDDHGPGSVSTNMKASVHSEPVKDDGGGRVSATDRQVYKPTSSGPSGEGPGH
jgi:hypothetical protein